MTNVTNSTRVKAPNIQALDFHSHTTVDGRINDAISLSPSGRDIADRNKDKGKLKLQEGFYYISNECTNY